MQNEESPTLEEQALDFIPTQDLCDKFKEVMATKGEVKEEERQATL